MSRDDSLATNVPSLVFTAVEGGQNPTSQSLLISNETSNASNWTATHTERWLDITPLTGREAATAATISVNSQSVRAGTYLDTIKLTPGRDTGYTRSVPVELVVSAPLPGTPSLDVGSNYVTFTASEGANPAAEGVSISNIGSGVLRWTSTHSQAWLRVTPTTGVNGSLTRPTLMMWVNAQGLEPGNYSDVVTVSAPGAAKSPQFVQVSLTVR